VVDAGTSAAGRVVVELNPDEIEPGLSQDGGVMHVWQAALRSAGDVVGLGGVLFEQIVLEVVDHCCVPARLVVDGVHRRGRDDALNVKVETVDGGIAPRSWLPLVGGRRAKCAPEEVREAFARGVVLDVVRIRVATSDGEEDLLAVGRLTCRDILADVRAGLQQRRVDSIVLVNVSPTRITEVVTWPSTRSLIGEDIDEADVDDIDIRVLAGLDEAVLVRTLTPVRDHIRFRCCVEIR
jgi:hypothetical protein